MSFLLLALLVIVQSSPNPFLKPTSMLQVEYPSTVKTVPNAEGPYQAIVTVDGVDSSPIDQSCTVGAAAPLVTCFIVLPAAQIFVLNQPAKHTIQLRLRSRVPNGFPDGPGSNIVLWDNTAVVVVPIPPAGGAPTGLRLIP